MYIYSVKTILGSNFEDFNNSLISNDGVELKQYDYVLLNGQDDTKENGVYMVNEHQCLERSSDFILFGPHFEDFQVTVLEGEIFGGTKWDLHVPLGSDFSNVSQVWVKNEDPEEEIEAIPTSD
jgi:hypothetical protein